MKSDHFNYNASSNASGFMINRQNYTFLGKPFLDLNDLESSKDYGLEIYGVGEA